MKQSIILRSAVVICAIALVGGYVVFRSKGGKAIIPRTRAVMPVDGKRWPATAPATAPATGPAAKPLRAEDRLMPGSKSAAPFDSRDLEPPTTNPGS